MSAKSTGPLSALLLRADLIFTLALFGTVMLLVLPIPAVLLDTLLALNIGLSLLVLLGIIYVKDPAEFSAFPTLLLALTLFRLALNISSTRQILVNGYGGKVIESFGNFVIQGNYIVGAVVFLILVVINFVVITKGAGRIAEVSARFTLDALPGKQMAIDAELNAGIIDEPTTARWTVPRSSCAAMPSPASSSRWLTSSVDSPSVRCRWTCRSPSPCRSSPFSRSVTAWCRRSLR
jgi:flagellar biosynthesis protein FlhA